MSAAVQCFGPRLSGLDAVQLDREALQRQRLREEIEAVIATIMADCHERARRLGDDFAGFWQVAADRISGGKLLRPLLLVQAVDALDQGQRRHSVERESVLRIAAAIELLHYAFVLHDDVIDQDLQRRHRSNLIGVLREQTSHLPLDKSAHWANTGGILMGDLMLSQAQRIWASEPMAWPLRERLLDLFDDTIRVSVAGEYTDVALADGLIEADLDTILEMCRRKTGAYTVELPLRAAAIVAGHGADVEAIVGVIGRRLGLAYQLQDDLLSTFGEAAAHGKDALSDLRERKQTAIIALAKQSPIWHQIEAQLGTHGEVTLDQAQAARSLLVEAGIDRRVKELIDAEFAGCHDLVELAPAPLGPIVDALIARLRGRQS